MKDNDIYESRIIIFYETEENKMNAATLLPGLFMLIVGGYFIRRYFECKISNEKAYRDFAALYLMIGMIGGSAGIYIVLFSLGLVK